MPSLFNVLFSAIKKPPRLGWLGKSARGPRAKFRTIGLSPKSLYRLIAGLATN